MESEQQKTVEVVKLHRRCWELGSQWQPRPTLMPFFLRLRPVLVLQKTFLVYVFKSLNSCPSFNSDISPK